MGFKLGIDTSFPFKSSFCSMTPRLCPVNPGMGAIGPGPREGGQWSQRSK